MQIQNKFQLIGPKMEAVRVIAALTAFDRFDRVWTRVQELEVRSYKYNPSFCMTL